MSAPAMASAQSRSSHDRTATIAALEQRAEVLQRRTVARNLGAVRRQEIRQQRAQIQEFIQRLEAGQPVDPQELDGILGRTYSLLDRTIAVGGAPALPTATAPGDPPASSGRSGCASR